MIDPSKGFSRRQFIAQTSCFGAWYAVARLIPVPALAADLAGDSRVSQTPIVDKGFASVRKIGEGLYATISDTSKGLTTIWNGGFLVGKDTALLLEGFAPSGDRRLLVEAYGVPAAEQKVAGVNHILFRRAHDHVRSGMPRIRLNPCGEAAQINRHRELRRIKRVIGQPKNGCIRNLENTGYGIQVALRVRPFHI